MKRDLDAIQCADCGATLPEGSSCQSIFESFLALEYTQPAYGEVHFLTVACFMIQHGRYSDEALRWIEPRLRLFLEKKNFSDHAWRAMRVEANQSNRHWKVTRQPGDRILPKLNWSMTIADVDSGFRDAQSYCTLVREWAGTTLLEMKSWLVNQDSNS